METRRAGGVGGEGRSDEMAMAVVVATGGEGSDVAVGEMMAWGWERWRWWRLRGIERRCCARWSGGAVAVVVAGAVSGGWEWRCGKEEEMTDLLLNFDDLDSDEFE